MVRQLVSGSGERATVPRIAWIKDGTGIDVGSRERGCKKKRIIHGS